MDVVAGSTDDIVFGQVRNAELVVRIAAYGFSQMWSLDGFAGCMVAMTGLATLAPA